MKIVSILSIFVMFAFADTGMKVNEQVLPGGGTDVSISKDRMAVVVSGGVDFYDLDYLTFTWKKVQNVPLPGATSVDLDEEYTVVGSPLSDKNTDYLYALQGGGSQVFLRYDILNNTWSKMEDIPERVLYGASLAVAGDKIYAIVGGDNVSPDYSDGFYVYDIPSGHWQAVTDSSGTPIKYYKTVKGGGGALVFDGKHNLYGTVGVKYTSSILGTVESHQPDFYTFDLDNPDAGWVAKAFIPKIHPDAAGTLIGGSANGAAMASDGQYIYLNEGTASGALNFLGGITSGDIWRYDMANDTWTKWTSLPNSKIFGHGGAITYNKGNIYVFRGQTAQFGLNAGAVDNYKFDTSTKAVTQLGDLPKKIWAGASLVFGGKDLFALQGNKEIGFLKYDFAAGAWVAAGDIVVNGTNYPIDAGGALVSQAFSKPDYVTLLKVQANTGPLVGTDSIWEIKTTYNLANPQAQKDDRFGESVGGHSLGATANVYIGSPNRSHIGDAGVGLVTQTVWNSSTPPNVDITLANTMSAPSGTSIDVATYQSFGSSLDVDNNGSYIAGDKIASSAYIYSVDGYSGSVVSTNPSPIDTNNVALDGNLSAAAYADNNMLYSFSSTWQSIDPYTQPASLGSVSIDQRVFMSTNENNLINDVWFFPIENDNTFTPGTETTVSLTSTPLSVASRSDFYKDVAVVNDDIHHQAVALDVPCGLRPTHLKANEWAIISVPCGNGSATVADLFADDMSAAGANTYCPDDNPATQCDWVVYKDGANYTGKSDDNVRVSDTDALELGIGYWIISDKDVTLKADANAVTTRTQTYTYTGQPANVPAYHDTPVPVAVSNTGVVKIMMGNPFPRAMKWEHVRTNPGGAMNTQTMIHRTAYVYDKTDPDASGQPYRAITSTGTPGFKDEIKPYQGFWINRLDKTTAFNLTMPFER